MDDHSSEAEKQANLRCGNQRPVEATKVSRDADVPHFPTGSDSRANQQQTISDVGPPALGRSRTKLKIKIINRKRSENQEEPKVELIIPEKKEEEEKEPPQRANDSRPRRACAAKSYLPGNFCIHDLVFSDENNNFFSSGLPESADTRISGGGGDGSNPSCRKRTKNLEISLTKEEIEKDFLLMTGKKPSRRPKKRPQHVQQNLKV